MVKQTRSLLFFLLAFLFALEPFAPLLAHAAAEQTTQQTTLQAMAGRAGLDLLFFTDPPTYLALTEQAALNRQATALAGLELMNRPSVAVLQELAGQSSAVKDVHAYAALQGLPSTLGALHDLISGGKRPNSQQLIAYHALITAALADLERTTQLPQAANNLAAARTQTFVANTHQHLTDLQQLLSNPPTQDAETAVWQSYLEQLDTVTDITPSLEQPQVAHPFTLSPLTGQPRTPYASRWDYLKDQNLLTAAHLLPQGLPWFSDPTSADLGETPDIHFTADIQSLASTLQSPVAIFNFVHDTVDTELYYGSKKGSTGTLYEMAGNDVDQASLLITLFRAADIPARYATGRVWLSAAQAQDLTNTTDTRAAADVLTTAGIPAVYVNRPGSDPVVEIEHTWVQAWLPYDTYRGVLEASTTSNWIDLDPFIKRYTFNNPVDLRTAVSFNPDTYLTTATTLTPVEFWENELRAYIQANDLLCTTWATASRGRIILPDNLALLPAELPVLKLNTLDTPSILPAIQRYTVTLTLNDDQGNSNFSYTASLPEIYGQRMDLGYPAATPADQNILDSYGGLFETPPYLVNVRPVLSVDETAVASGNPLRPGTERLLTATFGVPGLSSATNQITHRTQAGGTYVVGLDYQSVPQRVLDEATARLAELTPADGSNFEAQKLHVAILHYFRQFNLGRDDVTGILQSGFIRDLGAGFAAHQLEVNSLFGAPSSIAPGAYFLDVPKLSFAFYDLEGGQERADEVATLVGYQSSALEHLVWQQQFGEDSISAVRALQIAASQGQTLYTISSPAQVAGLSVSQDVKNAIFNALNRGWLAKVSQNNITLNQWNGAGYILYDPTTGSAGYLISGGLNGGSTTGHGNSPSQGGSCNGQGAPPACGSVEESEDALFDLAGSIIGDPVNMANGNLIAREIDLMVQARGIPLMLARWYNSIAPADGRFGYGWTDSFSLRIVANGDGSLSFIDQDGHDYRYLPNGSGGYTRPDGFHRELATTGSGYTLSDTMEDVFTFDENGRYLSLADPNGNIVTLNYSGSQLTSVTDAAGRTAFSFSYNADGRVSSVTDVDGRSVQYTYDAAGNLTGVTDVTNYTNSYTYDLNHRLVSKTDPLGNSDTFTYDGNGRMFRYADALGQVMSISYDPYNGRAVVTDLAGHDSLFTYDAQGRVTSRVDPLGNKVVNVWDADDNKIAFTDAQGRTRAATFNSNSNPLTFTDEAGNTTTLSYNAQGLLTSSSQIVDGVIQTQSWAYDNNSNLTSHTNADNQTTSYTYDSFGQITQITDPVGSITAYIYNPNGTVDQVIQTVHDADGNATQITAEFTYADGGFVSSIQDGSGRTFTLNQDEAGHVLSASGPGGGDQATLQYNAAGQLIQITDRAGYSLTYTYDALGRLITQTDNNSHTVRLGYTPTGQLATRTEVNGQTYRFQYDELGRLVRFIDPAGGIFGVAYCADSSTPCAYVDPNGYLTERVEDELGRIISEISPLGYATDRLYDEAGHLLSLTDAEGHTTTFEYDGFGRLTEVVDALNHLTNYSYDIRGNLTGLTDANNHSRTYVYDELSRLIRSTNALGDLTRYFYDGAGRLDQVTDANGTTLSYSYDLVGWMNSVTTPGDTVNITRNTSGKLTAQSDADSSFTYVYDTAGHIINTGQLINSVNRPVQYTYTPTGHIASITNAEGQVTRYSYDALDRLVAISASGGRITFTYDLAGRRTSTTLPNGIVTTYAYDAADHLLAQVSRNTKGEIVAAFSYTYDRTGHRTSMTDLAGQTTTYTYDDLYRLTNVVYGNGRSQSFTYDAVGNRLSQTVDGVTTSYTYDAADRLLSETTGSFTTTYTYDDNGNLIGKTTPLGTTGYTYDYNNQLVGISQPDGSTWSFGYSPAGVRTYELFTPASGLAKRTDFLLMGDSVLTDYATGGVVTHYLLGSQTDELFGQETGGNWTYYLQDDLGSVGVATNANGDVIARRSYDAFGAVLEQSGTWPGRYGFTGREAIGATGLLYYRARVMDAANGRFTSVDPLFGNLSMPETLHRYSYVKNDPVNLTDPSGKAFYDPFLEEGFFNEVQSKVVAKGIDFLQSCRFTPQTAAPCTVGLIVVTYYEVYYLYIAAFSDILFKYVDAPSGACALYFITVAYPQVTGIQIGVRLLPPIDAIEGLIGVRDGVKELLKKAVAVVKAAQKMYNGLPPAYYQPLELILDYYIDVLDGKVDPSGFISGAALLLLSPEFAVSACLIFILPKVPNAS